MRKILLATAAGLMAFVADGVAPAQAQAATEVTGQGTPTPGITVRFTGRYRMFLGFVDQSPDSTVTAAPVGGLPAGATASSLSSFDFMDYARLFPGFDGVAANGLRYGASLEIRMGSGGVARGDGRSELFFRRIWGYVGTPTLGQLRFGSGPTGAVEVMTTGWITGFGTGGWDGDAPGFIVGTTPNNFWWSSSGRNNYTKIGYFSPQFFGFDLGVSYGPNDGNFGGDSACSAANFNASPQFCDRVNESVDSRVLFRAQNIFEIMLRYRGRFGPVGVAASGGFVTSGVSDNLVTLPDRVEAKGLSVGLGGVSVSFAGVTVGGLITGGRGNLATNAFTGNVGAASQIGAASGASLVPRLDVPGGDNSNLFTWVLGANYTFGPFVVGAHYFDLESAGHQAAGTGKRKANGFAIGGTWNIAPGFAMFLEFMTGEIEESNVNLVTGAAGTTLNNSADVNLLSLGIGFTW